MASNTDSANGGNLIVTVENLLDSLEEVADLIADKNELIAKIFTDSEDNEQCDALHKFLNGLESVQTAVNVLKREKWRLSKRELSVELRIGELEEYKSHLRNDMSSLNQTVDVLSVRVIQLENQLVEAQETQESLEAQVAELKTNLETSQKECGGLKNTNAELSEKMKLLKGSSLDTLTSENILLKNENAGLCEENSKLKELLSAQKNQPTNEDQLARLTNDFLRQLSNLEMNDGL